MPSRDAPALPSFQEAFGALQQLANVFLLGRLTPTTAADAADAPPPRPGTLVLDGAGRIRSVDAGAEQLLGVRAADVAGRTIDALLADVPAEAGAAPARAKLVGRAEIPIWISRSELAIAGEHCSVLTLQARLSANEARTELRYRHLVDQIPAVVFSAALDGGLHELYVSPQIEGLLGYSQAEWLASPVLWYERLHPEDRRKLDLEFARGCLTGGPFRADCRFVARDGRIVWVHGEARLISSAQGVPVLLQGVAFDITETKRAEEIATASLREKETLLKEIHHRVKNNLQITSSLLSLQADRVPEESAQRALREGQGRIRSMALVHELLYRSRDLSRVDLAEYVRDLTRQLLRSHAVEPSHVRVETKLDPIPLPIDLAVPCGLVLNELVSNALKHAFPGGRRGTIRVELRAGEAFDELLVQDDGIGMPPDVEARSVATLGLRLIRSLAQQIGAQLLVESDGGTAVRLRIPHRSAR